MSNREAFALLAHGALLSAQGRSERLQIQRALYLAARAMRLPQPAAHFREAIKSMEASDVMQRTLDEYVADIFQSVVDNQVRGE